MVTKADDLCDICLIASHSHTCMGSAQVMYSRMRTIHCGASFDV
jgi:hypothetical protein